MLDPHHPLHASIVRIHDARTGAIVGAGFLAAPELVCTCAHVVADALNIPRETEQRPEGEVRLDFPFLGGAEVTARVHVWVRMEPNEGGGDIAVLRLVTAPSSAARSVRLLPTSNLSGRDFEAYGYPNTTDVGQWAYGVLRDRLANGYVQLESTTTQGYRVQRGYSGTPVWDQRGRGVVGMVVAEDRAPEAKVAFLIPNDLLQRACPDIQLLTFSQLFAPLTDGLARLPGSPLGRMEKFLREYLGTPDAPVPFGGRQQQLEELDRWLADPAHPYALLVAEAGRGKSALLAHWVARVTDVRQAEVVFVPISIRFSTSLKSTTMILLGARLRHLHGIKADPPRDAEAWLAEIDMYLREDRPIGSPLLIVLDGADEAADWIVGQDLPFPPIPGRGIKILVSVRPLAECDTAGWLRRLEWQGVGVPMELPLLDRAGVAEVLQSMGDPLVRLATQVDMVGELHRLSEGDPLLVGLYVEALRQKGDHAAFLKPEDLKGLEPGLQAYFDRWWKDQEWQWEKQGRDSGSEREDLLDFLRLCATTLGPLLRDEVAAIAGGRLKSGLRLRRVATEAGRLIIGDGRTQGYTFSHPKLGAYFREEQMTEQERSEWEQRFLDFGQRTLEELSSGKLDPRQAPPYAVRYYGAHLQRAGAEAERYYALVNADWLRAWEALEGTYDGFLTDLSRAWQQAEAVGSRMQSAADRGKAVGLQCRYALIMASIKSLAANIPTELLTALVDKGMLTPVQGLAYARQMLDKERQVAALVKLAPNLPEFLQEEVVEEALAAAQTSEERRKRVEALVKLMPHLPTPLQAGVLRETVAVAQSIEDVGLRTLALARLIARLPAPEREEMVREVLAAVQTIEDVPGRAAVLLALAQLVPHLPASQQAELLREALKAVRMMEYPQNRKRTRLSPEELSGEGLQEHEAKILWDEEEQILRDEVGLTDREAARRDGEVRAPVLWVLVQLVPHLPTSQQPELLREVLAVAQTMKDVPGRTVVLMVLTELASHLPAEEREEVLGEVQAVVQTMEGGPGAAVVLAQLVPQLPEFQQAEILREVLEVLAEERTDKATWEKEGEMEDPWLEQDFLLLLGAIAGLVLRLGALGHEEETLAVARTIEDVGIRMLVLAGLVSHLPAPEQEKVLEEALAIAHTIEDPANRVAVLMALAQLVSHLPASEQEKVLEEVLAVAHTIEDVDLRILILMALTGLVWQLPPSPPQPGDELDPDYELGVLVKVQTNVFHQTLIKLLWPPVLHPPEHLQMEVLREVLAEVQRQYLSAFRLEVAPGLVVKAPRRLDLIMGLVGLVPQLPASQQEEALREVLAVVRTIEVDPWYRTLALVEMAWHLPAPLQKEILREALVAAQRIEDVQDRAVALIELAPHLSVSLLRKAIAEIAAATSALKIEGETGELSPDLREALVRLVPRLGALGYGEEALTVARMIEEPRDQAMALVELVPQLPASQQTEVLREALAVAQTIEDEWYRAGEGEWLRVEVLRALVELVPQLSASQQTEVLREVLAVTRTFEDKRHRAGVLQALVGLVPQLPASLRAEILREVLPEPLTQTIDRWYREEVLQALVELAWHLPAFQQKEVLGEALAAAQTIEERQDRALALIELVPHLPASLLREALAEVRSIIALQAKLVGGEGGIVIEPVLLPPSLREALMRLVPRLGTLGYGEEALTVARMIEEPRDRAMALVELVPQLPAGTQAEVLRSALAVAQTIEDEWGQAEVLKQLVELVFRLETLGYGKEALAVARTIEDPLLRVYSLARLASQLPTLLQQDVLREALAVVRAIENPLLRAEELAMLAQQLPTLLQQDVLQEALAAARMIEDPQDRVLALMKLVPHLSIPLQEDVLQEALAVARMIEDRLSRVQEAMRMIKDPLNRVRALIALMPRLLAPLQNEVMGARIRSSTIRDPQDRVLALLRLMPYLPMSWQEDVLGEALGVARMIVNPPYYAPFDDPLRRVLALIGLIPQLPATQQEDVLGEALDVAWMIEDPQDRAVALMKLVPDLPMPLQKDVLREALDVAWMIEDPPDRTLAAMRTIEDPLSRVLALIALMPQLPSSLQEDVLGEALVVAWMIEDPHDRAVALVRLVPDLLMPLQEDVLREALIATQMIEDPPNHALVALRMIEDRLNRVLALLRLTPHLSISWREDILREALAAMRMIKDPLNRALALIALMPRLPVPLQEDVLREALDVAWMIEDPLNRALALMRLVPHLHMSQRENVLGKALAAVQLIEDPPDRTLAVLRTIEDPLSRVLALIALMPRLPSPLQEDVLGEALDVARMIEDPPDRVLALMRLVSHLSTPVSADVLREALAVAQTIEDEQYYYYHQYRTEVLRALAELVPQLLAPQQEMVLRGALGLARTLENLQDQAEILKVLAELVPQLLAPQQEMVLGETLALVRTFKNLQYRTKVLTDILKALKDFPAAKLYLFWCEVLHDLGTYCTRSQLLSAIGTLSPIIMELGGREALDETAQAIIEVGKWFP